MCGRTRLHKTVDDVRQSLGVDEAHAKEAEHFEPTSNLCPGRSCPVLCRLEDGKKALRLMRWGLVPSFHPKGQKLDFFRMFNARSETVAEKNAFRRLVNKKRCVVPMEGFFEWKKVGKERQPYFIHWKDNRLMMAAGLYDVYYPPEESGEPPLHTFTILTTRVSKALTWLHDRMPVLLTDEGVERWLASTSFEGLKDLVEPYEKEDLVWHPVSKKVNSIAYKGEDTADFWDPESGKAGAISKFFAKSSTAKTEPENEAERAREGRAKSSMHSDLPLPPEARRKHSRPYSAVKEEETASAVITISDSDEEDRPMKRETGRARKKSEDSHPPESSRLTLNSDENSPARLRSGKRRAVDAEPDTPNGTKRKQTKLDVFMSPQKGDFVHRIGDSD